ncbi:hypothetical protein Mgra_00003911 [Meloidogyne graminicola]|uniref:Uncharacterized protein n=1 Tax=Meloidogyne graminicola TaxID=189291 RepID=A0A8S9ZT57_9BILA|nr:hypothetical protein Mgra_00003911 [Meloidogyne graminicola]
MPHFKSTEVPCPQIEWQELMNSSIINDDPIASITSIQTALYNRFGNTNNSKFLVNCATYQKQYISTSELVKNENLKENNFLLPQNMFFSSSGDGYCNINSNGIWCQIAALQA